jgi:hypothetical protein
MLRRKSVERERKPDENVDSENKNNPGDDISSLWNEELKESYRTLTGSIRGLDADTRSPGSARAYRKIHLSQRCSSCDPGQFPI